MPDTTTPLDLSDHPRRAGDITWLRAELDKARRSLAIVDAIRDGIECAAPARCPDRGDCSRSSCLRCIADDLNTAISRHP